MPDPDLYTNDRRRYLLFHTVVAQLSEQKDFSLLRAYKPTRRMLAMWPNLDPQEYGSIRQYNDALYEYLERHNTTLNTLSWAEQFLFAHGIVPDSLIQAAGVFGTIRQMFANEITLAVLALMQLERTRRPNEPRTAKIVEGVRLGRIVSISDIRQSNTNQRLAIVDVGETNPRKIVCAGENILQAGHNVLVALPGAKYIRVGDNGVLKNGVIRTRKYNNLGGLVSEGELLSAAEAKPIFLDIRSHSLDKVCILPNNTPFKPGTLLDRKVLAPGNTFWPLEV